jgi:hypothetical protein
MNVAIMNQKAEVRQKPLAVRSFCFVRIDSPIKLYYSIELRFLVIPAKAGMQCFEVILDSRLRGSDGSGDFGSGLLIVAREPTVQVSLFLLVARDAKAHFELGVLEAINGLHLSVALFAQNLFLDVPFVVEKHILRKIIDLHPGC